jgi:hypothetical protein
MGKKALPHRLRRSAWIWLPRLSCLWGSCQDAISLPISYKPSWDHHRWHSCSLSIRCSNPTPFLILTQYDVRSKPPWIFKIWPFSRTPRSSNWNLLLSSHTFSLVSENYTSNSWRNYMKIDTQREGKSEMEIFQCDWSFIQSFVAEVFLRLKERIWMSLWWFWRHGLIEFLRQS